MRPKHHLLFLSLVLYACAPAATESTPDPDVFPANLARELQTILDEELETVNSPGATVTVQLADGRVWSGATGYADADTERLTVPDDRFRVGSVTKTFVAAVCMQLVEAGVWSLEDSIDAYVPGYNFGPEVSLRRVLSHTAGLYDFTGDPDFISQTVTGPADIITFALMHDPAGDPGQRYVYSNTGFILLGMALENVLHQPLHSILRERLLVPYELNDTYLEGQETLAGGHVEGYVAGVNSSIVLPQYDVNWSWAAGAMVSSGADQCHWLRELVLPMDDTQAPVNADSRTAMQTAQPTTDDGLAPYGLGLMLYHRAERTVIGHTGSTMGFKGEVFIDAVSGTCVSIQTNDFVSEPESLRTALWTRMGSYLDEDSTQSP